MATYAQEKYAHAWTVRVALNTFMRELEAAEYHAREHDDIDADNLRNILNLMDGVGGVVERIEHYEDRA